MTHEQHGILSSWLRCRPRLSLTLSLPCVSDSWQTRRRSWMSTVRSVWRSKRMCRAFLLSCICSLTEGWSRVLRIWGSGIQRVDGRKGHERLSITQQLCIHVDEAPDTIVFSCAVSLRRKLVTAGPLPFHSQSRATCHQQMIQKACHTRWTSFVRIRTKQRQPQRVCRALVTHTPSVMIKMPELLAGRGQAQDERLL